MASTKLGDDPERIITDFDLNEHRLGDLAKREGELGDIARLVLATGRVDCPGCNQRRMASKAFVESEGAPTVWLCRDCHMGLQKSQKRFKAVSANIERFAAGKRKPDAL